MTHKYDQWNHARLNLVVHNPEWHYTNVLLWPFSEVHQALILEIAKRRESTQPGRLSDAYIDNQFTN